MSDENVGWLVAKWRAEWKDADSTQLPDMNYLAAANELEAALSARGQPEPRVSQAMLDSQLETARLLDDLEKRSEARREKYGLHGQPVVDAREAAAELADYIKALNPDCCNASFPAAAAKRCMETITAALTGADQ